MSDIKADVYVSCGNWVARCPRPWCVRAEWFGPGPVSGAVGGLTLRGFTCAVCGLTCESVWPANAADIWHVLSQRPAPETRNWLPGETLDDLIVENALHGLLEPPPGLPAGVHVTPLAVDGRLTDTTLVLAGSAATLAIGGR